jgi:choline dehydrogenase-like flavoprotein
VNHGLTNLGVDCNSGSNAGICVAPRNIEVTSGGSAVRQDAWTQYLKPVVGSRSNLRVLTGAFATKINFNNQKVAQSVSFVHNGASKVRGSKFHCSDSLAPSDHL